MLKQYQKDLQMQEVIKRCDEALDGAAINSEDKEYLYLLTYAFQKSVIEEYNLDNTVTDRIYENLSKLESIDYKGAEYFDYDETGHFAPIGDNSLPSSQKPSAIYISEELDEEEKFRVLSHEICHLFQQRYEYNEEGEINLDKLIAPTDVPYYLLEAETELDSRKILEYLGYDVSEIRKAAMETDEENTICAAMAYPGAYATITPIVEEIDRIDGESIHKALYEKENYHGKLDLYFINKNIGDAYETDNIQYFKNVVANLEQIYSRDSDIEYLKNISHLEQVSTWVAKDEKIAISDVSIFSDKRILQDFYHQPTGEQNIADLDHITRSRDAENFLMAMNALKNLSVTGNIELNKNSIESMQYKEINADGKNRQIAIEYDGQQYLINSIISERYSTSSIKEINPTSDIDFSKSSIDTTAKPLDFEKIMKDNERFQDTQIIQKLRFSAGEEAQYFAHLCNAKSAPNILSASRINSYDTTTIHDINGNNLAHILANNTSDQAKITMKYFNTTQLARLMNEPNNNGITPIDIAIEKNNMAFLNYAANLKVNVNYENGNMESPLLISCRKEISSDITNLLLNDMSADPNKLTTKGISPLNTVLSQENNAYLSEDNNIKAKALITAGADVNMPSYINESNEIRQPLEILAGMGEKGLNLELFDLALKNGADIFDENINGNSVYDHMCETKNIEMFIIAAQNGYDKEELDIENLSFSQEDKDKINEVINQAADDFDFSA